VVTDGGGAGLQSVNSASLAAKARCTQGTEDRRITVEVRDQSHPHRDLSAD